eukprot:352911-Chlamydomonas_euryale.AAC.10
MPAGRGPSRPNSFSCSTPRDFIQGFNQEVGAVAYLTDAGQRRQTTLPTAQLGVLSRVSAQGLAR